MATHLPAWKQERRTLERVAVRVYQRYARACEGGAAYGLDWQTFRAQAPVRARVYGESLRRIGELDRKGGGK